MSKFLSSWKEVAAYLGKSVRTVQRWERADGLPIHRPREAAVIASVAELENWLRRNENTTTLSPSRQPASSPFGSVRVLVVDDERTIADTLQVILSKAGFEVKVSYDGLEAVKLANIFRPDIVVSDYFMPGLDGIEACGRISRALPGCRIIMFSGHSIPDELEKHTAAAGNNFLWLPKPMHPAELLRHLLLKQ